MKAGKKSGFFGINLPKRALIFSILLISVLSINLFSLDLELSGAINSLVFDKNRILVYEDTNDEYNPLFFPYGLIRFSWNQRVWESFSRSFNIGFESDNILRNSFFCNFIFDFEYLRAEIGPLIGLFNTLELPINPGFSGSLRLELPGIIFAQMAASTSLAFFLKDNIGYYSQNFGAFSTGFWLPFVIPSFNVNSRLFSQRAHEHMIIDDYLERWFLRAIFFRKNLPFTLTVDLGRQSIQRLYRTLEGGVNPGGKKTDEFMFFYTGMEGNFTINERLKILFGLEFPIHSLKEAPILYLPMNTLFYQARVGLVWSFL